MHGRIRFSFTFVVSFPLLLVSGSGPVASATAQAPTYTIIDLGTLGGGNSFAHGINAQGQVVGYSTTGAGDTHAFLWEAVRACRTWEHSAAATALPGASTHGARSWATARPARATPMLSSGRR